MSHLTSSDAADRAEIRRLGALYDLLSAFSRAKALPDVYDAVTAGLASATEANGTALVLFDSEGVAHVEASYQLSSQCRNTLSGYSPWPTFTRDAQPVIVPDIFAHDALSQHRAALAQDRICSAAFVPLETAQGTVGYLLLCYEALHECSESEMAVAQVMAGHLVLAIERRRAEIALGESERRLKGILDNSPAVIFLKDRRGRYILVNRRFEEMFQLERNHVLGKTDAQLFSAQMAAEVVENDRKVLHVCEPIAIEERIEQPDGPHTYLTIKFPVEDDTGHVNGICGIATDITERKRLEAVSLHLASIVESSDDAIVSKDLNGIITSWNKAAERIFGYTESEIVGKPVATLAAPDVITEMPGILERIRGGERVDHYETRRRTKDGRIIDVSLTVSPIRDSSGRVIGASKIARDITERRKLETAGLHGAAIVESSDDAIISKDLNGIITSWNKAAERVFGYTAAEIIGKPIATLAAPDVIAEMPTILERIRSGQRVDHYETRRRTKDGRIIDVSLTVSPIRDSKGRIIGASKIARDITDRKREEQERATLLAREQEARKTAELLNRVGPLLATELSLPKLVQAVTDVATELVGAEFGSFFHNVVNEKGESYMLYTLSGVPREAFEKFPMPRNTAVFAPTFRGEGIVRSEDITLDPRYGTNAPHFGMPKGHLPVRSYLAAPVVSRSGEVLGGLFFGHSTPGIFLEQHESLIKGLAAQAAIAMDNARLFEKTQAAQLELSRSNEELRRANEDLETFAYSASHDLQEPLRTIVITTQFLDKRYGDKLPPQATPLLGTVVSAAQRMETLIRDVLAYATATRQEKEAAVEVNANHVLNFVLQDLSVRIMESGATVTSDPLPVVRAHSDRLAQLFQNLIGNAIKYRSDKRPHVQISALKNNGYWQFTVSDNGIGIEPKYADQIFGLFKRLHSQDEFPGSGIGLALCQRIVEQYGGRIWLEKSAPGEGSTFCFTLPSRAQ